MDSRKFISVSILPIALVCGPASGQEGDAAVKPAVASEKVDKRIFGVLPNYRPADGAAPYRPITTRQKFGIGLRDSFNKKVTS